MKTLASSKRNTTSRSAYSSNACQHRAGRFIYGNDMKTCVTCKHSKPRSEYHKHCTNKDRHQALCKICVKEYHDNYRQNHNAKYNARYKRYALRHPERIKAKKAISNAIYRNKLNRPETLHCMDCFGQAEEYHHPSYSFEQRFNVVPVCAECHRQIHSNLRP